LNFYNGGEHGEPYGDRSWIFEQISFLPICIQKDVKKRYSEIFKSLSDDENQRFRSNTWLRKVVEKERVIKDKNDCLPF